MTPAPRRLSALALLLLFALASCGGLRPPAAVVNDRVIGEEEVAHNVRLLGFLADFGGRSCGEAFPGESEESACARLALSTLVQEELVQGYARARGIQVPDEELDRRLADAREAVGAEEFASLLEGRSLTESEVRELVRRLLLPNLVQEAVAAELITDDDVADAYAERILEFTVLRLSHIVVATKRELSLIAEDLTPDNFGRNARHFSTADDAEQGGRLGEVVASQLPQPVADAILPLEPGEISRPLRTPMAWQVVLLESKDVRPLDDVRDQLVRTLTPEVFQRWFQDQLDAAEIEVNPRYGRFDASVGAVLPIRSTATFAPRLSSPPASP